MIRTISHDVLIVVGGQLATYNNNKLLLHSEADICVHGEGEIVIKEVVNNLINLSNIKGISFKDKGNIITNNNDSEYIIDLDAIGFPPYHIFDMDKYFNQIIMVGSPTLRTMSLITTRGFPYSCNFCSRTFKGIRQRSVESVIDEINY